MQVIWVIIICGRRRWFFFSDLRRWSSWNSLVVLMNKKIYSFFLLLLLLYLRRLLCLGPEWSDERVQRLFGQNRKEEGAAADEKSRKIIGNYRNNRNNGKSLWVDFLLSSPAKAPAIASASASHGKRKEEREILNFVMFLIFFFISNILFHLHRADLIWWDVLSSIISVFHQLCFAGCWSLFDVFHC